ncbi:hypothetical protein CO2235_180058 [Cupriavidus oxalaticus]|uniref:Uncharacterized protein n=1 Tax=Cupriavidus oxalaticus TaxID=96344 RepID=A0A375G0T2_9BURK|nr:hypothetical protein CO2235_180058 [Cupriavidus oxalaticus]
MLESSQPMARCTSTRPGPVSASRRVCSMRTGFRIASPRNRICVQMRFGNSMLGTSGIEPKFTLVSCHATEEHQAGKCRTGAEFRRAVSVRFCDLGWGKSNGHGYRVWLAGRAQGRRLSRHTI